MNKKILFGLLHVQSLFSHVCIQKFNLFPVNSMAELPQMKKISPCLTGNDLRGPISQPMLNLNRICPVYTSGMWLSTFKIEIGAAQPVVMCELVESPNH